MRPISAQVLTNTHLIEGEIQLDTPGLFAFINRPTESYIEILEARMVPLHQVGKGEEDLSRLWLVKSEIAVILVEGRGDLGSTVIRAGYTKPFPYKVRIVLSGYDINGLIESGGKFDFGAVMFEGVSLFIPIYNVQLLAILFPRLQLSATAALFNRSMVQSIALLAK